MPEKQLSEMSSEELWELFPIVLRDHDPRYKEWFEAEKQNLLDSVRKGDVTRISHIGSTAVSGLIAKPIIDILMEIGDGCDVAELTDELNAAGWILMAQKDDPMDLALNKGYTLDGFAEKVYHLHVRHSGDWDELYFRDLLLTRPDAAKEYQELKLGLWKEFEHDRDGYTESKSDFVRKYSGIAKKEFQNRYRPR